MPFCITHVHNCKVATTMQTTAWFSNLDLNTHQYHEPQYWFVMGIASMMLKSRHPQHHLGGKQRTTYKIPPKHSYTLGIQINKQLHIAMDIANQIHLTVPVCHKIMEHIIFPPYYETSNYIQQHGFRNHAPSEIMHMYSFSCQVQLITLVEDLLYTYNHCRMISSFSVCDRICENVH